MAGRVKPIPVPVILAAVNGDEDALAAVVAHYQSYIRALATRPLKDDYGNTYLCVDEDEYSVRIMQLFRAFSTGLSEIRCSDSGLPWKRIPSANKSQQLISSQIWICRIMTAWHIRSFPGSVMMGETPWPSKSSQTPWYSLQRGSTTAGIKLTRFHYD